MGGDVTVVRDDGKVYDDGTIARVRILSVPASGQYPEGLNYTFHYGEAGTEHPVIRFDNHYGPHELHIVPSVYEIEFPGLATLYDS